MNPARASHLIAIVGGSGAGKGWLTDRLGLLFGAQACRLSLDDFYRDRAHLAPARRAGLNFDTPRAIDWDRAEQTLRDCRAGRVTQVPRYDFETHCRLPEATPFQPRRLVLVEGLSLLARAPIRRLFDLKIYLDCPSELRLDRRLRRDVAERGRTSEMVERQFHRTVAPMHALHVEPQRRWADLVLAQPFRRPDVRRLGDRLWDLFTAPAPPPAGLRSPFDQQLFTLLECHEHHD